MRNLTAPKLYENDAGTNFDAGCEGLVLYTPSGDPVRLHISDGGFLYINGVPFGVQGMPPAKHGSTHATGNPDAISPAMIGAMPASEPVARLVNGVLPVAVVPNKVHAATHKTGGSDELKATDIGGVTTTDPRLSDSRTPKGHAASHAATGGSDPISPADIGAVARDDERLTNKRDPLSHNATHFKNGLDPISWEDVGSVDADLFTQRERVPNGYPQLNDLGHIDANLLPQGLPPGPHATTHAVGGSDQLSLDGSQITTGTIPLSRMHPSAVERLWGDVPNEAARFALTIEKVQNGDSVRQMDTEPPIMWVVVDDTNLDNASGWKEYAAGTAARVPWSGIMDMPETITNIDQELASKVAIDGTSLMAENYLPTDPRHVTNKDYVDTVAVVPEIQITAEVFISGPEAGGVIPLGIDKPASNIVIPWNITTGNTTKTFRYVFQEDGVISALSRYQHVLYLNSVQTNVDYTFNSLIIAHVGGQVILLSGNLYTNRFGVSNPRVEIPLGNNVLTRDIKRSAGDYIDVEITATKSSGSPDVANILSGPLYDSKFVRNGGSIGSVNVLDFDGTDTTTQSVRNRSYEAHPLLRPSATVAGHMQILTASQTIYISKTGNDDNDGMSIGSPVLTTNRAMDVASAMTLSRAGDITFRFGAGDWGSVSFFGGTFQCDEIKITSITTTVGSEDDYSQLPRFTAINCYAGRYTVSNVVSDTITAHNGGSYVNISPFTRFGRVAATLQGVVQFYAGTYSIYKPASAQTSAFYSDHEGEVLATTNGTVFNFVEDCAFTQGTASAGWGSSLFFRTGYVTFTGAVQSGKNFSATLDGKINIYGSTSKTWFPGNGTYVLNSGGSYCGDSAELEAIRQAMVTSDNIRSIYGNTLPDGVGTLEFEPK